MAKRYFHWDAVDDCVLHETDAGGATTVEYTHEPGAFGPLLTETRSGVESYHHYDALGSTTFLSDTSGNLTDTFQYDAWGNEVVRTGTTPTPYKWVGRWGYQHDTPTGGYYIRARSYQPKVARWITVDPFFSAVIAYLYANNAPIALFDPTGNVSVGPMPPQLPRPTVTLEFDVATRATEQSKCGQAIQQIRWRLRRISVLGSVLPDVLINGWIIQHVTVNTDITDCDGNPDVSRGALPVEFVEGWQVTAGAIHTGHNTNPTGNNDTFLTPHFCNAFSCGRCNNPQRDSCRKGAITVTGRAKYVPGYNLVMARYGGPWSIGTFPSGSLPSASPPDVGWSDSNTVLHRLSVEFDCCKCPIPDPIVTGVPE